MTSMFRSLISSKVRSNAGCWTCRLRRKKCDEQRPVCEGCQSLEITCHYDEDKPSWMDGGPRQKDMSDKIKQQVKKQASQRRDRKYMEMLETGTKSVSLVGSEDSFHGQPTTTFNGTSNTLNQHSSFNQHHTDLTPPPSDTNGGSPPGEAWTSKLFPHQQHDSEGGPDVDVHFIMIYLDYVFTYLFPFYRPPVLSGGRGWVLDVLHSNKTVYHTAISLGSYYFSIIMANGEATHRHCIQRMVDKLQSQLEMGLRELQKEMHNISGRESSLSTRERLLVMQSIVQMVTFEVATGNRDNWKWHLDAAIAMFEGILPNPEEWVDTLRNLYSPSWPPPAMNMPRPWSTHQAALRFFTANLIHMDVMSSVTLVRPPRLRLYQESVIPGNFTKEAREHAQVAGPLFMDEFMGLHNWIVQMIGDVATLDAWKTDQRAVGMLVFEDLLARGSILVHAVKGSLEGLATEVQRQSPPQGSWPVMVEDPMTEWRYKLSDEFVGGYGLALAVHNSLWLQGILLYLYVVIYGWHPEHPNIRSLNIQLTESLANLPRGSLLRGLVFPFCVAGCLSPPEEEYRFRAMAQRMGPLRSTGTIKEATEVMETVWQRRALLDESWDVARCLNILGHASLLL